MGNLNLCLASPETNFNSKFNDAIEENCIYKKIISELESFIKNEESYIELHRENRA